MKDAVILLLCAVTLAHLAHGFNHNLDKKSRSCNCDPSEAQQICQANYDNDNVLIAHEKCDKFYKCASGKPVAYNCPNNLLYDPFTETCEWPDTVECGDRPVSEGTDKDDDSSSDSSDASDNDNEWVCNCNPDEAPSICAAEGSNEILVAHQKCNQFYKCAEGRPVAFTCAPTLLYNPYKEACDWAINVECGDRILPTPDSEEETDSDNDNDNENDGTCNCNPEEAPAICAAPDSESVLIAHYNCNMYFICNHGKPVAVSCSGNLLFNPYTKQCDWPRAVDCGDRLVPETDCAGCNSDASNDASCDDDDEVPPPGDDESQPPGIDSDDDLENSESSDTDERPPDDDDVVRPPTDEGTCNCNPEEAPSICASEDSSDTLVAHEYCNKFYKCDHGKPVALSCNGNLLYNPYTEQCDWPENVDCGDRVIPDPENDDNSSNIGSDETGDNGVDSNEPGGNCNPDEAPAICAADGSDGVLVAHENCNQFYKCFGGKPVALTCPSNLLFNPGTDQCDWPHNVDCGERVIPDPDESPDSDSESSDIDERPPGDDDVVRPPTDEGTCNCNPEEAPSICASEDSSGTLVAHEYCNKFYKCDHGKPVALSCNGNLLYNPYTEQCDWPENVDCGDRVIPDPENDDNSSNIGSDETGDNGVDSNEPGGNCNPDEAPAICAADGSDGVLVAHENCNQFYKCFGGKPVALTCPSNLLFNPSTDQCDWPHNVDCGERVIPDPDESPDSDSDSSDIDERPPGDDDVVRPPTDEGTCNCNPEEAPSICASEDSSGTLVAHEYCNKFYKCDHGKPVALSCNGNLLYNPYTEQCDWPENVDCGDRVIPDPENDDNNSNIGSDESGDNGGDSNEPGGNCNPDEAPAICAAVGSDGVLVAHENCNQFYKCFGGKPVALTCPSNLLFNPSTDQCDWPENVDCGERVIPDPENDDNSSNIGSDESDDNGGDSNEPGGNCNPDEAPAICAADGSDGVLVAHENCNQFYKCFGGKPVALTCPSNLLFNPSTDQCDWPHNVDCGERVIPDPDESPDSDSESSDIDERPPGDDDVVRPPTDEGSCNCDPEEAPSICASEDSSGTLVAHEYCNKFYKCDHGKPVALSCNGNLLYNPYTEQCDWPENVDCGDRVIPDPENDDNSSNIGSDESGDNGVDSNEPGGNCNPDEAPAICAADGSDGVLVAHENCNQFYKCFGGKPVALTCPSNLLFNPGTDQCDWPHNVDCGERIIPDPDESPDSDSESSDIDERPPGDDDVVRPPTDEGTCNCNPEEAPSICASEDSSGTLVAHEYCNKFYKCDHGKPVALSCNGNLLYNPYTEQCDWPENVDCGDRVIPDPENDDNSSNIGSDESGDNGVDSNEPGGNCNPDEAPAICAADGSDGVLVAHENCNQFYICLGGKPVALTCPSNLLFNPSIDQCDWPHNVDCGERVIPDPDESPDSDSESSDIDERPPGDDDVVRPPTDEGTCNCNPEEAPSICANEDSSGTLVAHEYCNKFYKCDHGKPVALSCNGNLLYNPYTEQCDWPENVDCENRVIPDPENDDNSSNIGSDESGDNGGDSNEPGGNCDPDEAPTICAADGSDGVLVAHENCNQFYICLGGKPVALKCPSNLLFNPSTDQCDWPHNVDCGERVIPDPDESPDSDSESSDIDERPPGDDDVVRPPTDEGTCNCNPEEAPSICASEDSSGALVAHEYCNKFYKCDHGKPVALSCNGNLLYNPYTEQCDWPENVDCGDRVIPDPENDDNSSNIGSDESGDNGGDSNEPGGNCNPDEAPTICAADGSDGVLVAHENCNQFYICLGGKPVALTCPSNLLFNPSIDQCDWPHNVDCGERVIPDPDESPDSDSESSDIDERPPGDDDVVRPPTDEGTCNCNPEEAPSICASEDSSGTLVAHEYCNKFYKCDHGKPVALSCNGNLLYNPYTEQCDWPENVDCGDRVIPDPENDDNNSNIGSDESGDNGGDSNEPGGNCNPDEAYAICAADGSDGVLVAHENCNQFYKCFGGKPVALTCPSNLLFNPSTDQCDWPHNVDCGERVIPDPDESPDSDSESSDIDERPPGDDDVVRPPTDEGTCNCNPEEAPSICASEDSSGTLVAHEYCNKFYKCDHGKPVALSCNGNLLYNPYTEQCDWPENVDCGDRVIPDPENDDNNSNIGSDESGDNGGDSNEPGGNCNPDEAPAICAADGSDGVLVAHENCNQFYKCFGGKPVALTCPSNLLFNPSTDQCDWPHNVDCGERVIPDPDESPDSDSESSDIDERPPGDDDFVRPPTDEGTCNCNPEEAPSICASEDSSGALVAHEYCNKFYKCDHGKPVALSCNGNLLYNPYTEQCDWPENVDCGDRVIPDPENDDNSSNIGSDESGDNGGDSNEPGGNCNPDEAPTICAADGSDGVLVAHENCNQFYICLGGKPVALTCPSNLLFNPSIDQCDWPHNVDCGERVIPDPDESPDSDSESSDIDERPPGDDDVVRPPTDEGTCNCNPEEAPSICASEDSSGTLVAHEYCNKFYKCDHGKPVALSCNGNLLYNPYTEQCDWPENVDCGDRVIPDPENDDNNSNIGSDESGDNGGDSNEPGGNCNPDEAPAICAADGSDGVLVAHENCNQFYKCFGGKPVALTCPSNLLFNPSTDQCDWPENVDCGERVIPDPENDDNSSNIGSDESDDNGGDSNEPGGNCNPDEAPTICAADGSDGVLVAHENCNQFYKCFGGKPVALACPSSLLFNPNTDKCDWPENVDCGNRVIPDPENDDDSSNIGSNETGDNGSDSDEPGGNCDPDEAPAICAANGSDGVLVAHEECNQFYKCLGGKPVALACPSSLLFNPNTDKCDWPENVDCGNRVIPDPENDDDSSDIGSNETGDNGSDSDEPGGNCDPDEAPAICAADGSDGVLVAHEECNQFYRCLGGKPIALACPSSLLFNPNTNKCDWPHNVDCGVRVIPDPDQSPDSESGSSDIDAHPPGDDNVVRPPVDDDIESDCSDNNSNQNDDACNCDPEEAPSICAVDHSDGVLIAHEICNQFYKCDNGNAVPFRCTSNLLYNPHTQECDWPINVECGDRVIRDPEDNNISENQEVEDDENGNDNLGPCNCNPEEAAAICAVDGSSAVQIAHKNCNQFYMCDQSRPVTFTCSGFLLYNPYTQQCDWPANVECGDRVIPEPGEDNDNESDVDNDDNNNNDIHDDPSQAPSICAGSGSEGVLVAHENCDQYYNCAGGVPVSQPCSKGLLFNPLNQRCDWPINVDCGDRIVPSDGDNDCACNPRNAPALCAKPDSDGKLIAHENCNYFYTCRNSVPEAHTCPAGLFYRPDLEVCDWPHNVDCDNRMLSYASLNKHWQSRQTFRK